MGPHVEEYVRYSSDEAGEVDRFERIAHLAWIEPEKPINAKDGLLEPSLHCINNETEYNWIDCCDKEVAMPDSVIHGSSYQKAIQEFKVH